MGRGERGGFHTLLIAVHTLHIQRGHSTLTFLMQLIMVKFDNKKYFSTADTVLRSRIRYGTTVRLAKSQAFDYRKQGLELNY